MVSIFKRCIPFLVLAIAGCDTDDHEDNYPRFIFRCHDASGCDHSNDDDVPGSGSVFGPIAMNREFRIYYGSPGSGYDDDGGDWYYDNGEDIYVREDVEVISASEDRLQSSPEFLASSSGLTAVIAVKSGKIVDYMYIDARPARAVPYIPDDTDDDTGEPRDTGDPRDTDDPDGGDDTDGTDGTDTQSADTQSDIPLSTDSDDHPDAGDDTGGTSVDTALDTDSSSGTAVFDTDEIDAGLDAGADTESPPDGGVDGGTDFDQTKGRPSIRSLPPMERR